MGIWDKTKEVGKKTGDFGVKVGKGAVGLGKKGYGATKDAVRKKECSECTHYEPVDDNTGDCDIAGKRAASANASTCPQKAFEFRPEPEGKAPQEEPK